MKKAPLIQPTVFRQEYVLKQESPAGAKTATVWRWALLAVLALLVTFLAGGWGRESEGIVIESVAFDIFELRQ